MTSFAEAVAWTADGAGGWAGTVPDSWMQGRAAFGGLVAAVGLRALQTMTNEDGPARSVSVSFFGPVRPQSARVTAEIVRRGRSMTHGRAEVSQEGELCTQVTAVFGRDRDSSLDLPAPSAPERPAPESLADMPFIEGVVPTFVQHFEVRWTDGGFPFTGSKDAHLGGWCRHRTDPGPDPHLALLGLLDVWPAPLLPRLTRPAPASSVTWSTLFVDVPETFDPEAWWWYRSETIAARHGHTGMRAALYHRDGRLAATVEQLVALFDRPAGPTTAR